MGCFEIMIESLTTIDWFRLSQRMQSASCANRLLSVLSIIIVIVIIIIISGMLGKPCG